LLAGLENCSGTMGGGGGDDIIKNPAARLLSPKIAGLVMSSHF